MGTANEHIRVSETVKRELENRRRDGESYNDVLERLLDEDDRDLLAGFGRWSDDHADRVRERREASKRESKARTKRLEKDE
ncbi:antitoxin VapB family protein [Halopiger goleimassiliensis]|uniref:antitoxin VapB family protein n=1 Tax=Halopiger goleimassiliensis TaxID=1293048 RepID=UPI0006780E9A|nr:antitoxin VapB family protein [Halopiger goleimassiliensis]